MGAGNGARLPRRRRLGGGVEGGRRPHATPRCPTVARALACRGRRPEPERCEGRARRGAAQRPALLRKKRSCPRRHRSHRVDAGAAAVPPAPLPRCGRSLRMRCWLQVRRRGVARGLGERGGSSSRGPRAAHFISGTFQTFVFVSHMAYAQ